MRLRTAHKRRDRHAYPRRGNNIKRDMQRALNLIRVELTNQYVDSLFNGTIYEREVAFSNLIHAAYEQYWIGGAHEKQLREPTPPCMKEILDELYGEGQ